jgi:hypothetical protein
MLVSPSKAQAMARDLQDRLKTRIAQSASGRVNTIREAFDTNGYPYLVLSRGGNEAEGQPVAIIYINGVNAVSKDIFGNTIFAAAPHLTSVGFELASSNDPLITLFDFSAICFETIPLGTQFQMAQIANGTAVTLASLTAATNTESYDWLQWPTKGV